MVTKPATCTRAPRDNYRGSFPHDEEDTKAGLDLQRSLLLNSNCGRQAQAVVRSCDCIKTYEDGTKCPHN